MLSRLHCLHGYNKVRSVRIAENRRWYVVADNHPGTGNDITPGPGRSGYRTVKTAHGAPVPSKQPRV